MKFSDLFTLKYKGQEEHLMMPAITTLTTTQALYDILFQYLLTPEQEQMLVDFINRIRHYLEANRFQTVPFSLPVEELAFLEGGIDELKLLCWHPVPVHVFEVQIQMPEGSTDETARDELDRIMRSLVAYTWRGENQILVYPPSLI